MGFGIVRARKVVTRPSFTSPGCPRSTQVKDREITGVRWQTRQPRPSVKHIGLFRAASLRGGQLKLFYGSAHSDNICVVVYKYLIHINFYKFSTIYLSSLKLACCSRTAGLLTSEQIIIARRGETKQQAGGGDLGAVT